MTSPQARKQIYDFIADNGLPVEPIYKDLSKLLKSYGRVASIEILTQLKTRLDQAIEAGEEAVKSNNKYSEGFKSQLIALRSMMKWTDGQLNNLNKGVAA